VKKKMKPNWKYHPLCLLFPRMTAEEKAELKKDMIQRVERGLPPLEHSILLYEDMILDGRNRFEVWYDAADENACDGYFKRNLPPTERFSPDKHGTLSAWMKVKSLNLVHRHVPADRKAAIFVQAAEDFPEVKAVLDEIQQESAARQKAGKAVAAGDRRGTTAEKVAKIAGVGSTTVKQVKKFKEVVEGKTTAKKALKEVKKTAPPPAKKKAAPAESKEVKVGDTLFQIIFHSAWSEAPALSEWTIKHVTAKNYVRADGVRIKKTDKVFVSLDDATKAWKAVVDGQIGKLKEAAAKLKDAIKAGPTVRNGK
jgi:hypothetical protein